MQKPLRLLAAIALIALGVWGWRVLFPNPERVIRSRLADLAATASFEPSDGLVPKARKAQSLPGFFTVDAEVVLEPKGFPSHSFTGRDELQEAANGAMTLRGLKVEVFDINVTLSADKQTAVANLTGKAAIAGESDFFVMEMNFHLRKVNGEWLIYRVETVKTLARFQAAPTVSQNCTLPYRGLLIRRAWQARMLFAVATRCRIQFGDTADYKSALPAGA